ncbi:Alpha- and gamma-adaptin-binding protein p34, partial [Globisporangium polare]
MKTTCTTLAAQLPPLMSALAVVGRPYDANGDRQPQSAVPPAITALPHVAALVSDFLDCSASPFWTIARACERNYMALLLRLSARADLAAGAADDEYERAREAGKGLESAVKHDNLEMVQRLHTYCPRAFTRVAMEQASKAGKLRLLQYIAEHFERVAWSPIFAELAAESGHLETLQWIWRHPRSSSFSDRNAVATVKYAARNGHLAVVAWLNEHHQWTRHDGS